MEPGRCHRPGCDVERCSVCGLQKTGCSCEGHDRAFSRWSGIYPGEAECRFLGYVIDHGLLEEVTPDLNRLYEEGLYKVLFVKPS